MNIGFIGPMGSGKTTAANYLVNSYGFSKRSFADPMRQYCEAILGITKQNPQYRKAMQELGAWGRRYDKDCWVKYLVNNMDDGIVIDDIRYINEAKTLLDHGFKLIYLYASQEKRIQRCQKRDGCFDFNSLYHESEVETLQMEYQPWFTECSFLSNELDSVKFFGDNLWLMMERISSGFLK